MDSEKQGSCAQQENNDTIVTRLAEQDKVPWYKKPNRRLLYLLMLPACVGVDTSAGFDSSMITGLQAVPSWVKFFHHPHSALLGFMVAAYSLGNAVALPLAPLVVDKFGRRYPIMLGGIIVMIGGLMQGFALNITMFIIARFILGFAGVFNVTAASLLIGELSHPNERLAMSCLFNTSYSFGAITAAGVIFGTFAMPNNWGWRIPSFLQVALGLVQVTVLCFLPESPRWLISRGRGDEAYAILVKFHAEGDDKSEFVNAEYAQIEQTLKAEQMVSGTSWKVLFSTPGMRKRAIIVLFLCVTLPWSGIGLISTYLSPILDSIGIHDDRTKNIINLSKVSLSSICSIICVFIAPRCSRRNIFLIGTISMFATLVSWTIASAEYSTTHSKAAAQATLAFMFLFSAAFSLGFATIVYAFLIELLPFHVRAKGVSAGHLYSTIAGLIANVVNPIGISAAGWKWYLVYCVWDAFMVVFVYFMIPETSGRTLEELTFLYESDKERMVGHDEVKTL